MKKLRWAMDGGFWDVDVSTPRTIDGLARAAPGETLPLGLSRGTRLSRPKQIHFMHHFMAMPFVPSYAAHGFSLQRLFTLPFFPDSWFAALLGQFHLQKFVSSVKEMRRLQPLDSSCLPIIARRLCDKSFYALALSSELLLTPNDTLLFSSELNDAEDQKFSRKKAVFQHKFPNHNLTVEAVWPGLFIDRPGAYWDVPLSIAIDLASVASDSGASYHLCLHHNMGSPKQCQGDQTHVPSHLLPGLCLKNAFSFKKNIDIWRSEAQKLKMVQPFDIFLSNPHISASGIIGAVGTASLGDNSVKSKVEDESLGFEGLSFHAAGLKSAFLADIFASLSFTAQHGNFQKLFLDLTRFHAHLDFPSGVKFISGTTRLAQDLYNSQQPSAEAVQAICPRASLSLQQQPFHMLHVWSLRGQDRRLLRKYERPVPILGKVGKSSYKIDPPA
ncbi:protein TRIGALACTOSYLDIACYLGLYCEROL 4, chloroplastic isoform X2 [Malania oleifera]|uniref:protein TRIGALACTOSYLDIACYLGLYCEROL 4, chloroplastic isoform X2 n=1 Tax=Malania oleifera TaxID=397392 RepID=UPI0025ADED25|nr:protein TRIGALACTOSYLDIACYLGLYCEROL 4, chloroplastic isoform X2 [Malania oleifera]